MRRTPPHLGHRGPEPLLAHRCNPRRARWCEQLGDLKRHTVGDDRGRILKKQLGIGSAGPLAHQYVLDNFSHTKNAGQTTLKTHHIIARVLRLRTTGVIVVR